jgi:hypothetical protein
MTHLSPVVKMLLYFWIITGKGRSKMTQFVTTVRLLVSETRKPLANVKVELFDRDEYSADDSLGVGVTNQFGEVTFKYTTKDFTDTLLRTDDKVGVGASADTTPDLYPVVYNSKNEVVVNRREQATQNNAVLNMLVLVDETIVNQNQLGTG